MSRRTGGRGLLAVGCSVAALVAALPGVAHAAAPPKQPLVADLRTGSKACAAGEGARPYVRSAPQLEAVLYDTDGGSVSAEYEVWWTDGAGAEQRSTYTSVAKASGSVFRVQLPTSVPKETVVSWRVRAHDGTAASPWSSDGDGSTCEFIYDTTAPGKAVVGSAEYPDDGNWTDGVGVYGSFTMDSPSDDVVSYQYQFLGRPPQTVRPDEPGGAVSVRYLPLAAGTNRFVVQAFDRAGNGSAESTHFFRVASGRAPVAHWNLADPAGSTTAAAETGTAAAAGSGVTFGGAAPSGTGLASAAVLDGSSHGYLTPGGPAVADPRKTFAVSGWARPAQTDRTMTVAAQDAGDDSAFALGLDARGERPGWSFTVGGARVTGGAPESGEWAHLLGVYDAETGEAQLYVNGRAVGTTAKAEPGAATGDFHIGRARDGRGHHDRWHGGLAGIRVHDRVVVPTEAAGLAHRKPRSLGHWSLENATDGASPEQDGGTPLKLGAGAEIRRGPDGSCLPELDPDCPAVPEPLVGEGHLTLDGETGHAATEGPVVDTSDSFSIGVVVRLADAEPSRPMTVLSQGGTHTDAFKVRYEPSEHAWQLVMPVADEKGAAEVVVAQAALADGGQGTGQRLAVVYDDATDRIRLYLDGTTNAEATADLPDGWESSGPLQVGRAHTGDGWGEYLRGDVDEVHAFAGALDDRDVRQLGWGVEPCLC
ncbi:LamG-like jellyroll fold domain-containing protein [Streptomyces sp. NPDC008159]|uniref:LamG domain-containing protein n=1 Tax=Streptomyces sp. NPDC008159 TaxID=3364817 RepID=UPI0036E2C3D4